MGFDEFAQPHNRAFAVAAVLTELDVHPHDHVLIMLPDGPGFTESFAAQSPTTPCHYP